MQARDITGKRFGRLVAVRRISQTRYGRTTWECICDCGNYASVTTQHLCRAKGSVKSCGCLKQENKGKNHKQWTGYKNFSGSFWSRIQSGARKDLRPHLEFSITIEYAHELFEKQGGKCKYSGVSLTIPSKWNDRLYSASLDRIDSGLGYVEGNVQWVHKDINIMKNSYSDEYFKELCFKVADNLREGGACPIK